MVPLINDDYVKILAQVRSLRGKIVSLRDCRYTDPPRLIL